jgi:hypothetical protein
VSETSAVLAELRKSVSVRVREYLALGKGFAFSLVESRLKFVLANKRSFQRQYPKLRCHMLAEGIEFILSVNPFT